MGIELDELTALRDALLRARYSGTRELTYDGKTVKYGSDAEMRAALADCERRMDRLSSLAPVSQVRVRTSKGL